MFTQLDKLPPKVSALVSEYFQKVIHQFGEGVDSIYLYGSVITLDYDPKRSDINSLILFDVFDFAKTRELHPIVKDGLKKRIVAPLCLAVDTFQRSADTFPLEFIEMKEKHLQIFGETSRLEALTIPRRELRTKIEEQLKGKLIRLRQVFMEQGGSNKDLLNILIDAQAQLIPVYRNLLRFLGEENPPLAKGEVLTLLEQRTPLATHPATKVFKHMRGEEKIPQDAVNGLFEDYVQLVFELATLIDGIEA